MKSTSGFLTLAVTAAGLAFMSPANAQQSPSQSPSPSPTAPKQQQQTAPANIPDKKLDQAAAAVKRLSSIKDDYEQKLAKAPSEQKDQIVGEADKEMAKAITDQGLSLEEYTDIMRVAQRDPSVRDKLLQRLK
jgi:hypothetical protein